MGYILAEILACLLLAGLIGGFIGWLLRGSDAKSQEEIEELQKQQMLREREYNEQIKALKDRCNEQLKNEQDFWKKKVKNLEHNNSLRLKDEYNSKQDSTDKSKESKNYIVSTSNSQDFHLGECYELEEIQGIGPGFATRLKKRGIFNTCILADKFLNNDKEIEKISKKLDIDFNTIKAWAEMADLMRTKGVSGEFAETMHAIGIKSRDELRKQDANHLFAKLSEYKNRYPTESNIYIPTLEEIKNWLKELAA